jgi:cob(I)alamin adenosyltransferase
VNESPPREKPYTRPDGPRRGLLLVHTGDGKGKTTAAIGLAVRALGRGKSVRFFQFMKVGVARFGEHRALEQLGLKLEGLGDGFSWKSKDLEQSAELARAGWQRAAAAIASGDHFLRSSRCSERSSRVPNRCTSWSPDGAAPPRSSTWPIP